MKKMNWGIIGSGTIVRKFAKGLSCLEDAAIVGVVSGHLETARKFAEELGAYGAVPKVYPSVQAMLEDERIEVVYIGVPNHLHAPYAIQCMQKGKHVLCEKPFTMNAEEARKVQAVAKESGCFCMEAMWTKFLPGILQAKEEIEKGSIGAVRYLHATFGFDMPEVDPKHRLFDLAKGGGALMDVGIYPITFAVEMMGGLPDEVKSTAVIGPTGVDEVNDLEFIYHREGKADVICHLSSAARAETGIDGMVCGDQGRLYFPMCYAPEKIQIMEYQKETGEFQNRNLLFPYRSNGYEYEAMEVMECIRTGRTESERHPLQRTIEVMEIMDQLRREWGMPIGEMEHSETLGKTE